MPRQTTQPRDRLLIGAVGGLVPVLLTLLAAEGGTLFSAVTIPALAGYTLQAVILAGLGAFVAWMHDDVKDKVVLAQLGLAAPMFLRGLISAGGAFAVGTQLWVATPLLAAGQTAQLAVPQETATQQFFRGLLGVKPQLREYLVEVYDAENSEDAVETMRGLQQRFPELDFQLFAPSEGVVDEWVVAIDGQVTRKEADRVLAEAQSRGVPGVELRSLAVQGK